nr:putative nuclease HARBI1 [Tanacetum cinerariifolium]GEZ31886.1 putative nuclease HARBI1 [Tanacetum cinerariifolium]
MNPNESDEERHSNAGEVDGETDGYFMTQAYKYHEPLLQEENRLRVTRNPIHRDREGAEWATILMIIVIRPDATGRMILSVIMKCTAVICQLAYGNKPDAFDDYLQMSEHTAPAMAANTTLMVLPRQGVTYFHPPRSTIIKMSWNNQIRRNQMQPSVIEASVNEFRVPQK